MSKTETNGAAPFGVLFVCTGNICRSPTAEGVFRGLVREAGLAGAFEIDSAGTHDYHVGEPPDERSILAAKARGYDLSTLRARKLVREDFSRFDLLLAMDRGHFAIMERMARPPERAKVRRMLEYARSARLQDVPDPYYGRADGFELVLDQLEDACAGLLASLQARTGAR